jgi:hypothetical protein
VFTALLRLHRAHLLRATRLHPGDVAKSPFAESLMPCYRSAAAMLAIWSTSYETIVSGLFGTTLRLMHPIELLCKSPD